MARKYPPFLPPKYKEAAEQISVETPEDALASVRWLSEEWRKAKTREKKRRLIKFASEAIRRCRAQLRRKRLSAKEREEFRQVVKIYKNWLRRHRLR
ncbi:MAG: hypothetical protein QXG39_00135 [Candidatus Aenigmatarchaeota archaeon]